MKQIIPIIMGLIITGSIHSQILDTIYLTGNDALSTKENYTHYRVITKQDELTVAVREFHKGDSLKSTFDYKTNRQRDVDADDFQELVRRKKLQLHGEYLEFLGEFPLISNN
ncbi:hypothetical protein [Alkalitalea saponilacus]|uniref:Uncharacterized protein n=1 Tax=Alkalitalea saponilacus TaxID=889453 RepID=A0A1T5DXA6_9BACT|nr:hypothetical protein [Alkalitalea saponilacus]ASB49154.1 hypothetical protein CDL62_08365 [Alkalitalea saponilacus]SKB76432.1 hypothetical protein SAMN03080601_01159 [Alkalitalea saponilacus]